MFLVLKMFTVFQKWIMALILGLFLNKMGHNVIWGPCIKQTLKGKKYTVYIRKPDLSERSNGRLGHKKSPTFEC
jgi:hypothetical protein